MKLGPLRYTVVSVDNKDCHLYRLNTNDVNEAKNKQVELEKQESLYAFVLDTHTGSIVR
jgi:hypothetical protein